MADDETHHDHHVAHDAARTVKLAVALLLLIGIVALATDNRNKTRIGWVVGDGSEPLWIILVVAAAVGALIGALITHRPRRH